jgi:hypothetical protein
MFNGTFTINSFTMTPVGTIVANGMIRGTVTSLAGQVLQTGLQAISLPVSLTQLLASNTEAPASGVRIMKASLATPAGARAVKPQFGCSGALQIAVGGAAAVNILGNSVVLSPMAVQVGANTGGTIGSLVCQITGLLGGLLDPSSLLNSLLGTITPLLGGVTGGLLGGIL